MQSQLRHMLIFESCSLHKMASDVSDKFVTINMLLGVFSCYTTHIISELSFVVIHSVI